MTTHTAAIGANVRRLRAAKGMNQTQLAEKASLSRPALRKIENDESLPQASTLQKLAKALGVSLQELVEPAPTIDNVRFRARKQMYGRDQILTETARWLAGFVEVEGLLGAETHYTLGGLLETRDRHPIEAARKVREHMDLDDEPVHDIAGLLEAHGIKVLAAPKNTDAFFGLSVGPAEGGPAVIVNTWDRISVERWIFSAAHELAHLVLHLDSFDAEESEEDLDQEKEADQFASHFLMPDEVFRREWDDAQGLPLVDRVFKVKRIFKVSYRTVLYRLVENGFADQDIWRIFQRHYKQRTGKTLKKADEPQKISADQFYAGRPAAKRAAEPVGLAEIDFREDRLSSLVRQALDQGLITMSRAAEVLGVDLRAMRGLVSEWVV